jgi:hypothetical protein
VVVYLDVPHVPAVIFWVIIFVSDAVKRLGGKSVQLLWVVSGE